MARRLLSSEERALWIRLTSTVKPMRRVRPVAPAPMPTQAELATALDAPPPKARVKGRVPPERIEKAAPVAARPRPAPVLDNSWEKRIRAGRLAPDHSIDLHGLNLAAAHVRLESAIGYALAQGLRVLLVVTGKPRPAPAPGEPRRRGAIRAEIGDWLTRSPHAHRIASVRQAHPRHGGEGALYIILRRPQG